MISFRNHVVSEHTFFFTWLDNNIICIILCFYFLTFFGVCECRDVTMIICVF